MIRLSVSNESDSYDVFKFGQILYEIFTGDKVIPEIRDLKFEENEEEQNLVINIPQKNLVTEEWINKMEDKLKERSKIFSVDLSAQKMLIKVFKLTLVDYLTHQSHYKQLLTILRKNSKASSSVETILEEIEFRNLKIRHSISTLQKYLFFNNSFTSLKFNWKDIFMQNYDYFDFFITTDNLRSIKKDIDLGNYFQELYPNG